MSEPPRLKLATLPSPIHPLRHLSKVSGHHIYVWRDDQTGCLLSGNKVRKLEFLLAEAQEQEADTVITCGAQESNHARATAWAVRQLGMQCHLLIRGDAFGQGGNAKLMQLAQAERTLISMATYRAAGSSYTQFLAETADKLKRAGRRPYVIPEGGSNALGTFGYVEAMGELRQSWRALGLKESGPDYLFCAVGSGGTLAGLRLGQVKYGFTQTKVVGVNVCDSEEYFVARIGGIEKAAVADYPLAPNPAPIAIQDGFVGEGYGKATKADFELYAKVVGTDAILLDPVYTGKAYQGMVSHLRQIPPGQTVLFLHTGGAFAHL
jgi:D-cysteine desulfhydrase